MTIKAKQNNFFCLFFSVHFFLVFDLYDVLTFCRFKCKILRLFLIDISTDPDHIINFCDAGIKN